jgi:uncharacterized phage protein (TIGR01671 family)
VSRPIKFRFWSKILTRYIVPSDSIFVGALKDDAMDVEQFTGLKDKHGVEIYEGDVVQGTGRGVVEFDLEHLNCGFVVNRSAVRGQEGNVAMPLGIPATLEVIGNIHEDGHLLEAVDA